LLVTGISLGIAYSAVPGAVNAEALRRGLADGFSSSWLVQTGALVGDIFWAILGLTGAAVLIRIDAFAVALGLIGAGFLFTLARTAFRSARSAVPAARTAAEPSSSPVEDVAVAAPKSRNALATGIVFSLANPAGLAFWTGLGGGILGTSGNTSHATLVVLLTGFTTGAVIWGTGMALVLTWGRHFAGGKTFRVIDTLCGVALSYFGVRLLWTSLQRATRWLFPLVRLAV
jgi:threonine/homoserine/homoserine lactone efflux protein